jgi:hypothetical protein
VRIEKTTIQASFTTRFKELILNMCVINVHLSILETELIGPKTKYVKSRKPLKSTDFELLIIDLLNFSEITKLECNKPLPPLLLRLEEDAKEELLSLEEATDP